MAAILLDGEAVAARVRAEVADRVARLGHEGIRVGLGTVLVGHRRPERALRGHEARRLRRGGHGLGRGAAAGDAPRRPRSKRWSGASTPTPPCTPIWCNSPCPTGSTRSASCWPSTRPRTWTACTPSTSAGWSWGPRARCPARPAGIVELLAAYDVPVEGRHVVIIGRGLTIGRPLSLLLAAKRPGCNAAVTVVHTGVDDLAAIVRTADVVVAAAGRAGLVTPDMIKPGAAVVGAGTSWEGRKLLSDVHEDVAEVAGWITPRLGGVGPMTRAMLLAQRRPGGRARRVMPTTPAREDTMTDGEFAERPWGNYTVLSDDAPDHKVKRIVVHPGKRLSYQRHAQRAEHWFFVAGTAAGDPGRHRAHPVARAGHRHPDRGGPPGGQRGCGPTSSSSRCSTGRTSARTTSSGSRTTSAGPMPGARRDADRRPAGGRADVLLRVLPPEERRRARPPWPAPSASSSRSAPRSSR